jgi:RNA 3'-terminal phosphate cyclase (ATP)
LIIIDGSYGEGGGQIIRTSIALSILSGTGVSISNIRKNRPQPGLKAQHLMAVKTAADMTHAQISGQKPGSTQLTFRPQGIVGGYYKVDIGTAGSITLLLQCLVPAAMTAQDPVILDIRGGTDVAWSPPVDYLSHVLMPVLTDMGLDCSIQVIQRGYYPRGGGRVKAVINPSRLQCLDIKREPCSVKGISHCSNLPEHVVQRQADSAQTALEQAGFSSSIDIETAHSPSTGSGISLWCGYMGSTSLGRRGLPAEKVGRTAAKQIIRELKSCAIVDIHLADQLIPYMGLAGCGSFTVRELTEHTRTNIWVVEQFLDVKYHIEEIEGVYRISL